MDPEPVNGAAAPKSVTAAETRHAPGGGPAGKMLSKEPGGSGPGEPYTPMPDLSRPARPRWLFALAAVLLALAAAAGILFMRADRAAAPAAQQEQVSAPLTPGPQAGN